MRGIKGFKGKVLLFLCLFILIIHVYADEGLWLFNNVPVEHIKKKYDFTVTPEWINHLQLSSAKMGGSASFVSSDGLVVTNHHVGASAIQRLSTKEKDLMKTGFYARTQAEELKCRGLKITVLQEIEDMTARVLGAEKPGMTAVEASQAIKEVISEIKRESSAKSGLKGSVVTLYSGAIYHLYKYKVHKDIRLVFAPEQQMAFFGGDPDNYGYPRYCLDVAFFRVYENGKPYKPSHYLKWNRKGLKEGELVFASGNPITTSRLLTMSQLEFLRDVSYPFLITRFQADKERLVELSKKGPEQARRAFHRIWGVQNSIKCINGQLSGLTDRNLMDQKAKYEKEIRDAIKKDPDLEKNYGKAWYEIEKAQKVHAKIYKSYALLVRGEGFDTTYFRIAQEIVRAASGKEKTSKSYEEKNLSQIPLEDEFEIASLTRSFIRLKKELGDYMEVKWLLGNRSPEEIAREMVSKTKLGDVQVRKEYIEGGYVKTCLSNDPMIKLVYLIDPLVKGLREQYQQHQKEIKAVETRNGALIAQALFELKGTSIPPDATSTLRLSFGVVKGYMEDGEKIPFQTKFKGLYKRSEKIGNKFPYNLSPSFIRAKSRIDLNAAINFVATCDASGGNSGSPLVNKDGEFIGILFDGNKQSLPARFLYSDKQARSVMVHSQGIIEALLKVYDAKPLVDEIFRMN